MEPSPTDRGLGPRGELRGRLAHIADRQDGVVSREQLRGAGVTRQQLANQARARRWRLVGQSVVLHRGPVTRTQRIWASILHQGPGACAASLTALELAGLIGWSETSVHVLIAKGQHRDPLAGVRLHESRRFDWARDVPPGAGPPRVSVARAAIDAGAWSARPHIAAALLAAVVQQRLTTPDRLLAELDAAGRVQHARSMRWALVDIAGGAQSLAEIRAVRLARQALPGARVRQQVRAVAGGQRRYLDLVIELPDGRRLMVEIDGAVHLGPLRWWADQSRQNDVVLEGATLLRFPSTLVRLEPHRFQSALRTWAARAA
jgi:very-short-patch-repair endonuclease